VVVDRFIANPSIRPVFVIVPLLLAAGTLTYFIVKGKVKTPLTWDQIVAQELKKLPVGSRFWGWEKAMPKMMIPAGFGRKSVWRVEFGTLTFIVPTGIQQGGL
jgi:hypothetical protein